MARNFDRLSLQLLVALLALYLVLEVVRAISEGKPPRTFEFAGAALVSLGALSALSFTYASLLPEGEDRNDATVAGEKLLASVIPVVVAAGLEFILRVYIDQPVFGLAWTPFVAWALLLTFGLVLFTMALVSAYPGIMTLWSLLRRRTK